MTSSFRYEKDMVKTFRCNFFHKENSLVINEMKIRWGNIDLVEINNATLPFSKDQCIILQKPSNAKIFMRLNNNRYISKETLFYDLGLSNSTFNHSIYELLRYGLICRNNNLFCRNVNFVFPNVKIIGYEAKLSDYNKALYQANVNKEYVDYSYMVFPLDTALKISQKNKDIISSYYLGLIGVDIDGNYKTIIKAKHTPPLRPYIRLINLVISYEHAITN